MSPLAPALFVLENAPRWESELKRRFAGGQWLVRPIRSTSDAVQFSRQSPGSVVVIDFSAGAAEGLRLLESLGRQSPGSLPVVIASREQAELEWPARELGAVDFVSDTIGGDALAVFCQRMLRSHECGRASDGCKAASHRPTINPDASVASAN
jgi:DNA-binding NtrC family response regulator